MSGNIPNELKYTKDHEWAKVEGETLTIGITDFAQGQLGDIVFVELPEPGTSLDAGSSFGVVESIKSVSDLYSPVSGEVVESNSELEGQPEILNSQPYESWMIKIKMSNSSQVEQLLDAEAYAQVCNESE